MRKYLILTFFSLLGGAGLGYLFLHSQSRLGGQHVNMEQSFYIVKQSDTQLKEDVLRIKDFLLGNYDGLVVQQGRIEEFCTGPTESNLLDAVGIDFLFAHDSYCKEMIKKVRDIETFKTRVAVYRNSILFLHEKSIEINSSQIHVNSDRFMADALIDATISFALLSNGATRDQMVAALADIDSLLKRNGDKEDPDDLREISGHAHVILAAKPQMDSIIAEILDKTSQTLWDKMHEAYLDSFQKSEREAQIFRRLLFSACVVLFGFIIFNILSLWRAARQLEQANENLESRVEERTRDLVQSQKVITDQQQALLSSAKMSSLGEMAGGVAHEINTPLATIQLRADQLMEYIEEDDMDKVIFLEALQSIDATVRRIASIVQGLRAFARDGRRDPMVTETIHRIVTDTLGLCRERFQNNGVKIDVEVDDLLIRCRPTEISQVLLNLLNNSFDAIQNNPIKWIRIEAHAHRGNAVIKVIDCGGGIPMAIQEKLMQPFFTTKEAGKGTGLGLSIAKGIIDSHGGRLGVDGANANTCFTIELPKAS